MIEIENILNAAKGAAGAKKSITTLFSVDFATISDSSNLKKIACGAWHTCPVAHMRLHLKMMYDSRKKVRRSD